MRGTSLSAWHGCVSQSWRWGPAVWAESSSARQVGPLRRGPSVSAVTFQASFVTDVISFNLGCPLLKKIPFKSHGLVTGRNPLLFGSQNPPAEQIASKQSRPPLTKRGPWGRWPGLGRCSVARTLQQQSESSGSTLETLPSYPPCL